MEKKTTSRKVAVSDGLCTVFLLSFSYVVNRRNENLFFRQRNVPQVHRKWGCVGKCVFVFIVTVFRRKRNQCRQLECHQRCGCQRRWNQFIVERTYAELFVFAWFDSERIPVLQQQRRGMGSGTRVQLHLAAMPKHDDAVESSGLRKNLELP